MALHPGLHILTCSCCWRASSICWRCFSICEAASFFCSSWAARSCSRRLMSCVIMVESCRSFSARLSGVPATEHMQSNKRNQRQEQKQSLLPMTLYTLPAVKRKGLHLMFQQPDVPHLLNIVSVWMQRSVILETEQQTKQVLQNRSLLIDLHIRDIKSSHNRDAHGISKFFSLSLSLEKAGQSQQMLSIQTDTVRISQENSWRPQKEVRKGNSGSFKAENGIIQTAQV